MGIRWGYTVGLHPEPSLDLEGEVSSRFLSKLLKVPSPLVVLLPLEDRESTSLSRGHEGPAQQLG